MNTNSFHLKGWAVTLISALIALYASSKDDCYILASMVPAIVMWFLDAYYLMQERRFRGLYKAVAKISDSADNVKPFNMSTKLYDKGKNSYFRSFISPTVVGLYLSMIIGLATLFFLNFRCGN